MHFIKSSGSKQNPEYQTTEESNFGIQLFWIVSLYTTLDKSYAISTPKVIFLTVLTTNSPFFCLSTHDALDRGEYYTRLRKKVYIQQYFKFIVTKLEIWPLSLFCFFPLFLNSRSSTVAFKQIYFIFNVTLLQFSDWEVCNVYRSRGITTAACKHVTSYFLPHPTPFVFVFLIFNKKIFYYQVCSESKGATACARSRAWILMLVKEQTRLLWA